MPRGAARYTALAAPRRHGAELDMRRLDMLVRDTGHRARQILQRLAHVRVPTSPGRGDLVEIGDILRLASMQGDIV